MIKIRGQAADLDDACTNAARILKDTSLPIISGLSTDIAGAKAALSLAQTTGAVIDHLASDSLDRQMRLLSYTGGFSTTSGEARNRADVILIIGKTPLIRESDLIKRLFPTGERLPHPDSEKRSLILLSGRSEQIPPGIDFQQIESGHLDLETSIACLSAYTMGKPVSEVSIGEDIASHLKSASARLKESRYAVIVYSPAELSEPAVHAVRDLINFLNDDNRAASLAVSGRDNVIGVSQVCGWTTGYPLRTSFARGHAEYNPHLYETGRLLNDRLADAIVWVSSLSKTPPPSTVGDIPKIVLSLPGMEFSEVPDILIEVGEPGVHHDAAIYRPDYGAVVAVKQKSQGQIELPTAAYVLTKINEEYAKLGDT